MRNEQTTEIPDEWLVPTVPAEESSAESLGSYKLCFEVGSGGMATVYLAAYQGVVGFERVVAVKRIHPHLTRERQFVDMFFDEARIAAAIDHPFVSKVVDVGRSKESYFLAMEYLMGEPLSEVFIALAERPQMARARDFPLIIARIAADLCEGLHAAHELTDRGEPLGIVHRDVNPSNLFVLHDGTVRVVDFGIAKAMNKVHHTETGTVKGTYAYVSPEQLQLKPVDRRCDLWSLGVVLWELLTGERLFKRDSPVETIRAVTSAPIPAPSEIRPGVPPELDAIVVRACSRWRDERYHNAREMALDLERFLCAQGRSVSRSEVADWVDTLFPGALARKQRLVERTRHGDVPVPAVAVPERHEPEPGGADPLARGPGDDRAPPAGSEDAPRGVDDEFLVTDVYRPAELAAEGPDAEQPRDGDGASEAAGTEAQAQEAATEPEQREAAHQQVRDEETGARDQETEAPDDSDEAASSGQASAPGPSAQGGRGAPLALGTLVAAAVLAGIAAWGWHEGWLQSVAAGEARSQGQQPTGRAAATAATPESAFGGASAVDPPAPPPSDRASGSAATGAKGGDESGLQWRSVHSAASDEASGGRESGGEVADARGAQQRPERVRRRGRRPKSSSGRSSSTGSTAGEATGTVQVMTQGQNAEVFFEGESRGKTPASFELPAGQHELELRLEGGGRRKLDVEVRPGRRLVLSVTL